MSMVRRIGLALLLLPLLELVAFVAVAMVVGFWRAVALALLTSVLGALLLRSGGGSHLRRFRTAWGERVEISADAAGRGAFRMVAGLLLLVPGFVTDVAGLLLLLPATRRRIGDLINRVIAGAAGRGGTEPVVDLAPDEWQRQDEGSAPDVRPPRRLDDRRD